MTDRAQVPAPARLGSPRERLWLLFPAYFDAPAFLILRTNVLDVLARTGLSERFRPVLVFIDDSAGLDAQVEEVASLPDIRVIRLPFNVGHQRALVYGLRTLAPLMRDDDFVVTLDSDGEDQPADLPRLLEPLLRDVANPRKVALAARTRRHEPPAYKVLYFFFKWMFLLLAGTVIRSGNYAAYRGWLARNVVFHPHFDLCYSSSLLSLNLQIERVPCERGRRYAGTSKMTYLKLVMHGLRMLMPFADRIAVRGLLGFAVLLGLGLALGVVTLAMQVFTGLAIPGWATYTFLLAILLCGTAVASLILLFSLFAHSESLSLSRLEVDHASGPRGSDTQAPAPPERVEGM